MSSLQVKLSCRKVGSCDTHFWSAFVSIRFSMKVQARAELMERRLAAASKLIIGLASERTRWTADTQVAGCAPFLFACMLTGRGAF